jgi:amino acid transporter
MKHISKFLLIVSTLVFSLNLLTFQPVNAQDIGTALNGKSANQTESAIINDVQKIINFVAAIAAAIAVLVIVYGAFIWIIQGQENGQKLIQNAVIGLIVLTLAYFIAQLAFSLALNVQKTLEKS